MLDIYNIQGFKLFDFPVIPQKAKNLCAKKFAVEGVASNHLAEPLNVTWTIPLFSSLFIKVLSQSGRSKAILVIGILG
jgi:hypothetical protein